MLRIEPVKIEVPKDCVPKGSPVFHYDPPAVVLCRSFFHEKSLPAWAALPVPRPGLYYWDYRGQQEFFPIAPNQWWDLEQALRLTSNYLGVALQDVRNGLVSPPWYKTKAGLSRKRKRTALRARKPIHGMSLTVWNGTAGIEHQAKHLDHSVQVLLAAAWLGKVFSKDYAQSIPWTREDGKSYRYLHPSDA